MPQINLSIDSAKLDFAIGILEGTALAKPAIQDSTIDKKLKDFGFTEIEIMLTRQMQKERLVEIKNPKPKAKVGRKPKSTKVENDGNRLVDEDYQADNVLGI
jgi:hypothetical protein